MVTTERAARQEWRTPPDLFEVLDQEFEFHIDAAATKENALCAVWYGPGSEGHEDALSCEWIYSMTHFCNPGFGNFLPWVEACIRAASERRCTVVLVGLVAPSTKWWTLAEQHAAQIRLCAPRPQFLPPVDANGRAAVKQSSNPREIAVFVFTPDSARHPGGGCRVRQWRWKDELAHLRGEEH